MLDKNPVVIRCGEFLSTKSINDNTNDMAIIRLPASQLLVLFWLFMTSCHVWAQQGTPYRDSQNFQFALIQVPIWVADKKGRNVSNLDLRDLEVRVDKKSVKIESFKRTYFQLVEMVFFLDISGSMALGGKMRGSIETMLYITRNLRPDDRWKWVVFADNQVLEVLNQQQAHRMDEVVEKIKAYGKTCLFDALSSTGRYFSDKSKGARAVLLFTDGNDNQSQFSQEQILALLSILDVPVFTVGIADGFWPSTMEGEEALNLDGMRKISEISGGYFFMAESDKNLPEIARDLRKMLRAHYQISFVVERGPGESRHSIDVKCRKKSYRVRSRKGYIGYLPE